MAILKPSFCPKCKSRYNACISADMPAPKVCYECQAEEDEIVRKSYFDNLDKMSIEERLRRVEEWIFNYKPPFDYRNARF